MSARQPAGLLRGAVAIAALLFLAAQLSTSCATAPRAGPLPLPDYPGTLTRPSEHPGDFLLRQHLTAHFGERVESFDAVLQKRGDVLTLVGLTPFGTRAFLLEQTGLEVKFTSYVGELPFPPRFILFDVERVYFDGIAGAPLDDGEHVEQRSGERIVESWNGGRLAARRFTRIANDPPGVMSIVYAGGMASGAFPAQIEIDNGWVGYKLSIATLSEQRL